MLFSGLQSHAIAGVAMDVFGDTNDSSWHLSLEFVFAGNETCVWATIAHGHAKSLGIANADINAHLSWWSTNGERKNVSDFNEKSLRLMELGGYFSEVFKSSKIIWVLDQDSSKFTCF